jgi:hypothetical protein
MSHRLRNPGREHRSGFPTFAPLRRWLNLRLANCGIKAPANPDIGNGATLRDHEGGTRPMTSLADLLDPDQWIVSGKNLSDFPWPDGSNEREAMKLILSTRPSLKAHFERWSKRVMEALGRRGGEKVGDVFMEEYLRELWERSRASS